MKVIKEKAKDQKNPKQLAMKRRNSIGKKLKK